MKVFLLTILALVFSLFLGDVSAYDCIETNQSMSAEELQGIKEACQAKIDANKSEQNTLKQAINSINAKINLAQAQINQTNSQIKNLEEEISVLSGVLETVNQSMDDLSLIYLARVRESYRRSRVGPVDLIFASGNFSEYFTRMKYLNTIKAKDQLILIELEKSRLDYDQRKNEKIVKQQEIEKLKAKLLVQRKELDAQQSEKQQILVVTQNDEKKYQALLAKVRAELQAIESIIAGKGSETFVSDVNIGDRIASVIPGASACSTGGHLHFEVVKNGSHLGPGNFLKSKNVTWDNSPDGEFPLSGSWDWPLEDTIRITQGYGHTAFSSRYAGDTHTGIDMINKDNYTVKSVRKGKLYRGSIPCGGGTLKYVHVDHVDDEYDTFYLHVNYF